MVIERKFIYIQNLRRDQTDDVDRVILWTMEHRVSVVQTYPAALVKNGVETQLNTVPVAVASITVSVLK